MIPCPSCAIVPHGDMSRRPPHLAKSGKKGWQIMCDCTRFRYRERTDVWTYVVHLGLHPAVLNCSDEGLRVSGGSHPTGHPDYRKFRHPHPSSEEEIRDFILLADVAAVMVP